MTLSSFIRSVNGVVESVSDVERKYCQASLLGREKKSGPYRTLLNRIWYLLPMSVVINDQTQMKLEANALNYVRPLMGPLYLPMRVISCSWLCVPQLDALLSPSLPSLLNSNSIRTNYRWDLNISVLSNLVASGKVWPICFWLPFLRMC